MKTNENNATVKTAAQARREIIQQEVYELFVQQYGEEEAKRSIEEVKPRLDNDAFPIIFPEPFEKETLPDVDFLVTIGKPNLVKLRSIERQRIDGINRRIKEMQKVLAGLPQSPKELDNRSCNYDVSTGKGHFGERCSYSCPFYQENREAFVTEELRTTLEAANLNTKDFPQDTAFAEKMAQHRCPMYDSTDDPNVKNQRATMRTKAESAINELRDEKYLHVKYIHRITKAVNDKRSLPNVPIFVDWRSLDFLKENQVVCTFLSVTSETALYLPEGDSFKEVEETKTVSTEMKLFFCKITGDAFSSESTSKGPMIFVSSHSGDPIKCGELYVGHHCPIDKFLSGNVTREDIKFDMQPIPAIDQRIPRVMKVGELLELKRHPEYARIWAYTNHHGWHTNPDEIEPMLEAIKNLNI